MLRTVWCLETWQLTHTHSCTYTQSNTQATTEHRMENEQRWNKIQKNRMCFTLRLEALLAVLIWLRDKSTCRLIVSFSLHWSEWTGAFRTMPSEQCQAWASTCGRARLCHAVPQLWQVSKSQQVCGSIPWDSFNGDTWWGLWIREEMKDHPLSKRHFHWSHTR